jgi:LmbE family N-acetylglucosaminyl deacetylase
LIFVEPNSFFQGTMLIAAPHMDDGVLACGGTISQLAEKERVFFVYATDGSRSPVPVSRWQGSVSPNLTAIREREARAALGVLGIPQDNIHFLGLPDAELRAHSDELGHSVGELVRQIAPSHVLIPFRYDRHPDHLALNQVVTRLLKSGKCAVSLTEYFVYYRWQLIPGRDIRRHIQSDLLLAVDVQTCSSKKKRALMCFTSQTTRFFDWQDRPILPEQRVDEMSHAPEVFLGCDPDYPGASVFGGSRLWIRLVHKLEPGLKQRKDQALALWKTIAPRNERQTGGPE